MELIEKIMNDYPAGGETKEAYIGRGKEGTLKPQPDFKRNLIMLTVFTFAAAWRCGESVHWESKQRVTTSSLAGGHSCGSVLNSDRCEVIWSWFYFY